MKVGGSPVNQFFSENRVASGSRSIMGMMREAGLVRKQPGSHTYKQATVARFYIPNLLNRELDVILPNQVCVAHSTKFSAQARWH